jgi:glycosyltransferase involved in cell wall biosynthesis
VTRDFELGGGLEQWTYWLAQALRNAAIRSVVYVMGDEPASSVASSAPFEVVHLAPLRTPWEDPLVKSNWPGSRLGFERARLNFICLRNALSDRLSEGANIVLSNYATGIGLTGSLVSEDLSLDHVVVVAGTDFSRGFRNSRERAVLAEVCSSATLVVGKSVEQIQALRAGVDIRSATVIETGVSVPDPIWRSVGTSDGLRIFSDCGFSHKRGSGVLLEGFRKIHLDAPSTQLEICGRTEHGQEDYWSRRISGMEEMLGEAVQIRGYLSQQEILDRLYNSHIYASATLGEGSSAARATALCIGIPMVTTACGELAINPEAQHIRLVRVGDAEAFYRQLSILVQDVHEERVEIRQSQVAEFRARFDVAREWQSWCALFNNLAAGR